MFVKEPIYRSDETELDHLPVELARELARTHPNTWRTHAAELRNALPFEEFDYISGAPAISRAALNKMRAYKYLIPIYGKKISQEYLLTGKWEEFSERIFAEKEAKIYDIDQYKRRASQSSKKPMRTIGEERDISIQQND